MEQELKPCPFCGETAIMTVWNGGAAGATCDCSGTGPYAWMDARIEAEGRQSEVVAEAVAYWNTRPIEDALRARAEAAEAKLAAVPWDYIRTVMQDAFRFADCDSASLDRLIAWYAANRPQEGA
jgi:hypothetical protein